MVRCWMIATLAPLGLFAAGCLDDPGFTCQSNAVCFVEGVSGECDFATNRCVYPTPDCPSQYRDGEGECVAAPSGDSSSASATNATAGPSTTATSQSGTNSTTDDSDSAEETSDPTNVSSTGNTDPTIDPTDETTSSDDESTSGVSACGEMLNNITSEGVVNASSSFDGYSPGDSIDADLTTSWFSSGPEDGDAPSVFTWSSTIDRCVSRIFIADNALNSNPDFRTGFGFGSATIRVVTLGNDTVYEETFQLPGTPDGDITADTGGVVGNRVVIQLHDHENESCGGFAELQVLGGDAS